jgi:hypothetical protein
LPFTFDADTGEIPPGRCDVEIVDAVPGVSSKGNENLRLTFRDAAGRQVTDWLTYLPSVRWRWRLVWECAGLPFPHDEAGEIDERDLLGRTINVEIAHDTYEGRTRSKVIDYMPAVGSDIPSDVDSARGFAAAAGLNDDSTAPY